MRKIGRSVVICLALLGAPMGASAKGKGRARAKADVVTCSFGWPSGLNADVTYHWTRTKKSKPVYDISGTARMIVTSEGNALRVAYRDWKKDPLGTPSGGMMAPSLETIATIVNRKGTFLRLDGAVSAPDAAGLAATVSAQSGKDPGGDARKQLAQMVPILFQQNAERTWDMLVASWTGVELEIGEDYVTDAETPVPLLPGEKLKSTLHIRAERRVDCPNDTAKRCVELKYRQEPDRESMARLVDKIGEKFGSKALGAGAADVGVVEEFTLVTEPERLIPYLLDVTKTVGKPGATDSGQVDRTSWTFDYSRGFRRP